MPFYLLLMYLPESKSGVSMAVMFGDIAISRDNGGPEDAVGDMQDALAVALNNLTPSAIDRFIADKRIQFLLSEAHGAGVKGVAFHGTHSRNRLAKTAC
jgi:hypothetical protein